MTPTTVIVTDAEQRAALAVVRSLGAAGYRCVVTSSSGRSIAAGSRFVARTVRVPDALAAPREFANSIIALAAAEHAAVVLPIADQSLLAVLPERLGLGSVVVPFPDMHDFQALNDKQRLLAEASRLGIRVPDQYVLDNPATISNPDLEHLTYPIVVKPARSVSVAGTARVKFSVSYAANVDELVARVRALPAAAFPLLLQQRITGPGVGIFLLLWDGQLRAQFAHRRLCEKPPSGGVSVYRESVPIDETLRDLSSSLLERFSWRGVAMVEYKRDSETDEPYLMEVNGRFWGSLQLAVDSGVDFPRLLVESALGRGRESMPPYRIGVRSRWWWGQVDHLVARARRKAGSHPLPVGTASATSVVGDLFLGPFRRRDYEEVLRWDDPKPFCYETLRWIRRQ